MTREIKFRAWDKKGKKFQLVSNLVWVNGNLMGCNFGASGPYRKDKVSEKDLELMQFTGLKDKNGKEIYEGDIVQYLSGAGDMKCAPVFWDKPLHVGWSLGKEYESFQIPRIPEEREIIGNIYENPELLK